MDSSPEQRVERRSTPPGTQMLQLMNGFRISQALHVAATLGIADLLRHGARSSDDLASACGAHPGALYRLLRALASEGVFHEAGPREFSLTALGECLRSDAAVPIGPWCALAGRPYFWAAWSHLFHSVKTGENAFRVVHGCGAWDYRAQHPDEGVLFDGAMSALTKDLIPAILASYDFADFARIVDVGGGSGTLLGGILARHPGARGVLFDQPHVVANAPPVLAQLGVQERCEIVAGSFFAEVPSGDAHILKSILHDWDDQHAREILRSCRRSTEPAGKLLVIERVLRGPNEGSDAKFADLNMLVVPGGMERSEDEFAALFASTGFQLARVHPTGTGVSILEGISVS